MRSIGGVDCEVKSSVSDENVITYPILSAVFIHAEIDIGRDLACGRNRATTFCIREATAIDFHVRTKSEWFHAWGLTLKLDHDHGTSLDFEPSYRHLSRLPLPVRDKHLG